MKEKKLWMYCNQCMKTVLQNDVGICLGCQGVYNSYTQPDSWQNLSGKEEDRTTVTPLTRQHARDLENDRNR
jgi:hypothetical protein